MFFELLTFPRDGVPAESARSLINYLSTLQFVGEAVSDSVSAPVLMPEFQAAVKRTLQFFHAISTEDRHHFDRMMKAWLEGMKERGEPVVWLGCVETLRCPEIMAHPLCQAMVVTLCAVADVYACRLGTEGAGRPGASSKC